MFSCHLFLQADPGLLEDFGGGGEIERVSGGIDEDPGLGELLRESCDRRSLFLVPNTSLCVRALFCISFSILTSCSAA